MDLRERDGRRHGGCGGGGGERVWWMSSRSTVAWRRPKLDPALAADTAAVPGDHHGGTLEADEVRRTGAEANQRWSGVVHGCARWPMNQGRGRFAQAVACDVKPQQPEESDPAPADLTLACG